METADFTPVMAFIKPTLDRFMKQNRKIKLTDALRQDLAKQLDDVLKLQYNERMIRVVDPESNGNTIVMIFTRDSKDKQESKFTVTTVTIRDDVPEELTNE